MSEVSKYDKSGLLPKTGYLYFFADMNCLCGYEASDCYGMVFYYDVDRSELKRVKNEYKEYRGGDDNHYPSVLGLLEGFSSQTRGLKFESVIDYPTGPEFIDKSLMDYFEAERIWDYLPFIGENYNYLPWEKEKQGTAAKLLGHEELIRCSEFSTCERIYQELYGEKGGDWLVLLQYGAYLFYIRKEDLINRNFDRVWLMTTPIK